MYGISLYCSTTQGDGFYSEAISRFQQLTQFYPKRPHCILLTIIQRIFIPWVWKHYCIILVVQNTLLLK